MGFTKKDIKKKSNILINFVGLLFIIGIILIGFIIINNIDFIKLDILKNGIGEKINNKYIPSDVENEKSKNLVNILLTGRGGGGHDAPNLTDTIILVSINFDTNIISMLSIPRDLYVEYEDGTGGKINKIYAVNSFKNESRKIGMEVLLKKVEEITKQKIDYFINVDFNGFKELINTIGGIELTIPKQFIDTEYPDGNWGYKTIIFKKGTWLFDGENALKYARSRHSTSDFDRSLRQQQIIDAIRNKLTAGYFLSSPLKIKDLYNVFIDFIHTNIELQEILKLAVKLKTRDFKLQSFNINDSCFYGSSSCAKGGLLYIPNREYYGGASVLLPEGTDINNLSNYKIIHKYTNLIFNNSDIFEENYQINIFNSLKKNFLASLLADEIKKYGLHIPEYKSIGNTKKVYEKSILYYNNIEEDSKTIQALKDFFPNLSIEKTEGPIYSENLDTNIEIIIGEDYKEIFNQVF